MKLDAFVLAIVGKWMEYNLNRQHLRDGHAVLIMATDSDGEMRKVKVNDCKKDKDPLKDILVVELLLNAAETEIVGIDVNGEIVIRK